MDLTLKLKSKVISTYLKLGNDKVVLIKGDKSYTGHEIVDEITNETEFGVEMLNNLLSLTIDLVSREKLNIEPRPVISEMDSCIALFDNLTDSERIMVMDEHCNRCGTKISDLECDKCNSSDTNGLCDCISNQTKKEILEHRSVEEISKNICGFCTKPLKS
jgi:hypothetical protein